MANISRETHDNLVGAVEDAISYALDEARKEGELVSGETAWNIVLCRATAKVLEFEGHFIPDETDMGDVSMRLLVKEEETTEDTEHF